MSRLFSPEALTFSAYNSAGQAVALLEPLEYEIVSSFDSPARSFEGMFRCPRAFAELHSIEVLGPGRTYFAGAVDETTVLESDGGRRLRVLARSAGAALLDNEAKPQLYTSIGLRQLFQNHIYPYGFATLTTDEEGAFMNTYQILKGMSEWEAFSNFFRNTGLGVAYVSPQNDVMCMSTLPTGAHHTISNQQTGALRYASLKITDNRYSPITQFVIRDNDGLYSYSYDNPKTTQLQLRRKRYLIPSVEYTQTPTGGAIDASLRVNRSMLGKRVVTVTCPGLLDTAICDSVDLDTQYDIFWDLFVHQVRYRLTAGGITTALTLLEKQYV